MTCKLSDITNDELSIIPTTSLQSLINTAAQQKEDLNTKIAYKTRRRDRLAGTVSVYSPVQGRTAVKSTNSLENDISAASKLSLPVASLSQSLDALQEDEKNVLTNNPLGLPDLSDYGPIAESLNSKLSCFSSEIPSLEASSTVNNSEKVVLLDAEVGGLRGDLASVNSLITRSNDIITKRGRGELEEPAVNTDDLPDQYFPGVAKNFKEYVEENVVLPMQANFEMFNSFSLEMQGLDVSAPPPVFDLTYGPPVSVKGQFVLSQDGLYYDSRGGGLPVLSGSALDSSSWELEYAPNLGGKGIFYGDQNLTDLKDTVFSDDYISDSKLVALYYDSDDILQNLERNKSRQISIVSGQINDLIEVSATAYSMDSAMVVNYYNSLGAIAATYDDKIRKRKKQLQLVALFASGTYSFTTSYEGAPGSPPPPKNIGLGDGVLVHLVDSNMDSSGFWTPIERIPVNDFTFLKGKPIRLSLGEQKDLVLFSEDLEDTILPVTPKFLVSEPQPYSVLDKFSISPTPIGEFPSVDGDPVVSGTGAFVLSLQDHIVRDSLMCMYNFLRPNVVEAASLEYNLDNNVPDSSGLLNAQLVGSGVDWAFPSGLGIPYFRGTFYNPDRVQDASAQGGCYAVLPTNKDREGNANFFAQKTLNNLTYTKDEDPSRDPKGGGFSFDFWTHVPNLLGGFKGDHRYRLLLANENSGGLLTTAQVLPDRLQWTKPSGLPEVKKTRTDRVHGLIIGFRDIGGLPATTSGVEFIVKPTVSQNQQKTNTRDWGHSVCLVEDFGYTGDETGTSVAVPTSQFSGVGVSTPVSGVNNGVTLGDVSNTFVHMCLSFDYNVNKLRTMVDGELWHEVNMASSLMVGYAQSLNVPTWADEDDGGTMSVYKQSFSPADANYGPSVSLDGETFTPWVLGGGFTDGIPAGKVNGDTQSYAGFLGYNTNDSYYDNTGGSGAVSQHNRSIPLKDSRWKSGLNGYIGSFKVYGKPLSSTEAKQNFNAQKGFFKNIAT